MSDDRTVLAAYGRTVAIHAPGHLLCVALTRLPPTFVPVEAEPERTWRLAEQSGSWVATACSDRVAQHPDGLIAAELLLSDLELWVAAHAQGRIFVHAGCVVWHDRAIVLPGRTMSGKSSLTAALVRAGAAYSSDEYAVLDEAGHVEPYARPLSIRPYDGGPRRRVPVEEFGCSAGSGAQPVGMVARLRYDTAGAGFEAVTPGQAVLHLLDNIVPAQTRPAEALASAAAAVEGAVVLEGSRGDADDAAQMLLARCGCDRCTRSS